MTPSNPDDARYTLTELAALAGVTPRTVRYYLSQGLLTAVGVSGPGAKYDDAHLARLRLIKQLQAEHQPLAEIRHRLSVIDDATVVELVDPTPDPPSDSALEYLHRIRSSETRPVALGGPVARLYRMAAPPAEPELLQSVPAPSAPAAPAPSAPARVERSQWERIGLGPDVEIHIRRPLPRTTAKRVDRLVEIARDLFEEA